MAITAGQLIRELAPGQFARIEKVNPSGSLEARRLSTGAIVLYWRFTFNGKTERITIGDYDSSASPKDLARTMRGYSIAAARRSAESLAIEHKGNLQGGGYPALVAARKAAQAAAASNVDEGKAFTLRALLADYCDLQKVLGRPSYRDARSMFNLHVCEAFPYVADQLASAITAEQIADMMRRLHASGKGRTANKLRSYLRSAYQIAKSARANPAIPIRFKAYGIVVNPADDALPDASQNKADKNPLSADELRTYWLCIRDLPAPRGPLLRLHLLTGGQRIEQLVKLRTHDIGDKTIKLLDGKGRPGRPARPHVLPLIPKAVSALAACNPGGEFALSTDGGTTHIAATTLSVWAADAAGDHIDNFLTKRIRSGVETLLSFKRVSREVRGQLQSHGITGVQARHYDANDFMDEKRDALSILYKELTTKPSGKRGASRAA